MTNEQFRIGIACIFAAKHGTTDGGHHKMWVIDQMVRILVGPENYELFRESVKEGAFGDGLEWDEGIAP
ncbi:hypothetical protein NKJ72_12155 [Mesorhizobium sp. M0045]|uniref:hypothetical protein n=1 Tax=Mesorhizobium sp. M0045 TaxID=2956857 RepID=UPI00333DDD5A